MVDNFRQTDLSPHGDTYANDAKASQPHVEEQHEDQQLPSQQELKFDETNCEVNATLATTQQSGDSLKSPPRNAFFYVNKNGYTRLVSQDSPPKTPSEQHQPRALKCADLANVDEESQRDMMQQQPPKSAEQPNGLVRRDPGNGQVVINTNMTVQEPHIHIDYEKVKYANIFAWMCCWCFPLTGFIAVIYARMTRKHYNERDMVKASKYLNIAEWLVLVTIFIGATLISVLFLLLEVSMFGGDKNKAATTPVGYRIPLK